MSAQPQFIKTVKATVEGVQTTATERFGTWNKGARKAIDEFVQKGRVSQKDLSERIQKVAGKANVSELTRKVKEAQERAVTFVNTTSRDQAAAVAESLRKAATRIDQLAQHRAASSPSTEIH